MGQGGKSEEHLQMVTANVGNHTPAVYESASWDTPIVYLCSVYFQYYYVMRTNCYLGMIEQNTAYGVEPDCLISAEIHSWTLSVNQIVVSTDQPKWPFHIKRSIAETIEGSSNFQHNEGLAYPTCSRELWHFTATLIL